MTGDAQQMGLFGEAGGTAVRRLRNKRNGVVIVREKKWVHNEVPYLSGTVVDVGRTGYYMGQVYGDLEKNWEIEP
jgi:hypothetical protein